ncbi:hypothetical protein [Iningainema tapete]|uniref:Uncharacterized protein n=1 Tax=Iningainema tapete BLCC-T55 TaxID=2748662 RepID=A0A8J6XUM6_9CYAN|nr:hypothetical protein [Iningainema tapete]MBD2778879.1 hypothetical protein [Iningainema tapete BLCC-T55]
MNHAQKFTFQLEEPWTWEGLAPPDDPLGELSDFQMGLRRFCFERNHKVLIEFGDEIRYVFLDPDIILLLESLPSQLSELLKGKKIEIDFPESYFDIKFVPVDNKISCTLQEFGYSTKQKLLEFAQTQVLEVLRNFLNEVMGKAVDGGYITSEEKEEFLLPMR